MSLPELPSSLFIVSLPRSFSSAVYNICALSLDFQGTEWASDGEILNMDRISDPSIPVSALPDFFLRAGQTEDSGGIHTFLDTYTQPRAHVYKDVVQPFCMASWLEKNPFPTLILHRSIPEIAYSMWERKWFYPINGVEVKSNNPKADLVKGLIQAEDCLSQLEGLHLEFNEIVRNEDVLYQALESLYPGYPLRKVRYIDTNFNNARQLVESRRETTLFMELSEYYEQIRCATL